jgi:hypothetical protein
MGLFMVSLRPVHIILHPYSFSLNNIICGIGARNGALKRNMSIGTAEKLNWACLRRNEI